jgi:hypothetical protein
LYQQFKTTTNQLKLTVMKDFNKLSKIEQKNIFSEILTTYVGLSLSTLELLIEKTSVKKVQFVKINGYQSASSNGTETADQLINVGASYENMLDKDADLFKDVDLSEINVDNYKYQFVNMNGLTLDEYKQAVVNALPLALIELQSDKKEKENDTSSSIDTSATIKLNSTLFFNRNTRNLNIFGMQVYKKVTERGEVKIVKKAPKTVAKEIIKKSVNSRASKLRTFTIQNIVTSVKINGSELLIV